MNSSECIRVLYLEYPPYIIVNRMGNMKSVSGFYYDIFLAAAEKYKYCYQLFETSDSKWFTPLRNGSYGGNIGLLNKKLYDVFITGSTYAIDRIQAADFSEFVNSEKYSIIFTFPRIEADLLGFVKPFSLSTWIAILVSSFLLGIIFGIMLTLDQSYGRESDSERGSLKKTFPSSLDKGFKWIEIGLLNLPLDIWKSSERMMIISWLLVTFVLTNIYKADLLAELTAPSLKLPFDTVNQMAESKEYKLIAHEGSFIQQTIANSKPDDSIFYKMKRITIPEDGYLSDWPIRLSKNKEGFLKAHSFHLATLAEDFAVHGFCRMAIMKDALYPTIFGMTFQKKSNLTKKFNRVITAFKEGGISEHVLQELTRNATNCIIQTGDVGELRPLSLTDFLGIFALLGGGLVLSSIAFLCELVYHGNSLRRRKMKLPPNQQISDGLI